MIRHAIASVPFVVATGVAMAAGLQSRCCSPEASAPGAARAPVGANREGLAGGEDETESALDAAERTHAAATIMQDYATRTAIGTDGPGRRYLWTDAFAVCNFMALARKSGNRDYEALALRLIERVHRTLGRHRSDDPRSGWLSGLDEKEGARRPTRGGLRIGKELPERGQGEPLDRGLEWDRDGQYFHYLTKWMHALDVVARATGEMKYARWAVDLAETAHGAFAYGPADDRRMFWKMSIDLSRPLVPSMGHHDPLDGYVTYTALAATAAERAGVKASLKDEISDFATMMRTRTFATDDPLGLGGLLADAYRLAVLVRRGAPVKVEEGLVERLLTDALDGVRAYAEQGEIRQPANRRLAFRELGLAIGLSAVSRLHDAPGPETKGVRDRVEALQGYAPLGEAIVAFWLEPEHQRAATWTEHRDINSVMLATSLVPDGFLGLV